ncbi:MAG: FlgD immunoglobulin-like domain containing protein [Fibrobacteria bacterium]
MDTNGGRIRGGAVCIALSLFGLTERAEALDVNVRFSGPNAAVITVTHVPAKEALGAIRLRLRLKAAAGAQVVAAAAPELGPWAQVMPEVRRIGDNVTVWALAPNLGRSLDGNQRLIVHLDLGLSPSGALAVAEDLIDSVIVEEAFGPSGAKTTVGRNLSTGLALPRGALSQAPVEKIDGITRTLNFALAKTQRVRVFVSDFRGRRVADVFDRKLPAGMHELTWNGRADGGGLLAAGTYSLRFEAGTYVYDRKLEVQP